MGRVIQATTWQKVSSVDATVCIVACLTHKFGRVCWSYWSRWLTTAVKASACQKWWQEYFICPHHLSAHVQLVSCPAGKIGGKIRLVTLRTILDTRSNFHTFRQEFERANRNTAFFNHCNSGDRKCELRVHSFAILASVRLQLRQLTPWLHSAELRASTKNSAQCYQTGFSSDFSGWAWD